jgi:hypothetical protein
VDRPGTPLFAGVRDPRDGIGGIGSRASPERRLAPQRHLEPPSSPAA